MPETRELQGETEGFFEPVKEKLFPRIIKNQSTAVDAITGCTASSNAVKSAIDQALAQALEAGGSDPSAIEAFHTVPATAPRRARSRRSTATSASSACPWPACLA